MKSSFHAIFSSVFHARILSWISLIRYEFFLDILLINGETFILLIKIY